MVIAGRSGNSLGSMVSFAVVAQVSSLNRYTFLYGDLEQGVAERLLFIAVYAAPLFAGTLLAARRSIVDLSIAVIAFCLSVLIPALYGSRMGVLWGGSFALSAYLGTTLFLRRPGRLASSILLLRMIGIAALVLMGLSLATMLTRYAVADSDRPLYLLIADPFSFFAAFAMWFQEGGLRGSDLLGGYRNFESILELVGLRAGRASVLLEDWPAIDVGFTSSNVYTLFRFLIEDFGTGGALVWLGVFGVVSTRAFRATLAGTRLALPFLVLSYAVIFTSFSMSLTYYTTVVAAAIGFLAYFGLLEMWMRSEVRASRERPTVEMGR
jgi:oligosaccharide repeat unit polymerase